MVKMRLIAARKGVAYRFAAVFAFSALLLGAFAPIACGATYVLIGNNFGDPNSWSEVPSENPGLPGPSDTAQIGITNPVTPTGLTVGALTGGSFIDRVVLSGGSLSVSKVQLKVDLRGCSLTVRDANGLQGVNPFVVESGSQLTTLEDTSGFVSMMGGTFDAKKSYGGALLTITGGAMVTIEGDALLDAVAGAGADGQGSSLTVLGTLSMTNGTFIVTNGATVSSGAGIVGPDTGSFNNESDALLDGQGCRWTVNGPLQIGLEMGSSGGADVAVRDGAVLSAQSLDLAVGSRSGAGLNIGIGGSTPGLPKSGGSLIVTGPVRVGVAGYADLNIDLGSTFQLESGASWELGVEQGSRGRVLIDGPSTTADAVSSVIQVGAAGDGSFSVSGTNHFTSGEVKVAVEATSGITNAGPSAIAVTGPGTIWDIGGPLTVGVGGNAEADVYSGALLKSSDEAVLGAEKGGVGYGDVNGLSQDAQSALLSQWQANGGLTVGESGQGTLVLEWGGNVLLPDGTEFDVGSETGSTGNVSVIGTTLPGSPTLLEGPGAATTIGGAGVGAMTVSVGGKVETGETEIGGESGGNGTVTLQYAGSTWNIMGGLTVGSGGNGTLLVKDQTSLSIAGPDLVVGEEAGAKGVASLNGTNTSISFGGDATVGGAGTGALIVQAGALFQPASVTVAEESGSKGTLTVAGGASRLSTGDLTVGGFGAGTLVLSGQATLETGGDSSIAEQLASRSTATLDGVSTWTAAQGLTIGSRGIGALSIKGGSTVYAVGGTTLAEEAGSGGTLIIDGQSTNNVRSMLVYGGEVHVGEQGDGALIITNGGRMEWLGNSPGVVLVGIAPTASGSLVVADHESLLRAAELKIALAEDQQGGPGTTVLTNGGAAQISSEVSLGDNGLVDVRGGSMTVGLTNPAVALGVLQVNHGGTLSGCGRVEGTLINNGGTVAPGCSPGTLSVDGDYLQASGGLLRIRVTGGIAGGASNDLLSVSGNVSLAGALELNFLNGFAARKGQQFVFLSGASNLAGNFTQVTVNGLAAGFQYIIGPAAGGSLSLTALNDGVAASAPPLVATISDGRLFLTWPGAGSNLVLQGSTNLATDQWYDIPAAVSPFVVGLTNPAEFFRLKSQ